MYDEIHIQGMWFNLPGYTFSFGCIIEFRETGGVYISPYYTLGQYVIVSSTDLSDKQGENTVILSIRNVCAIMFVIVITWFLMRQLAELMASKHINM